MEAVRSIKTQTAPAVEPRAKSPEPAGDSGKVLPPAGKEAPPPPKPIDVQRAVEQIQTYLSSSQRSLQFRVTEDFGPPVMVVTNPETGEVIRQIPGEEVQKLAAAISQGNGRLLDTLA